MEFSDNKTIYLQIAEWIYEQILNARWKEGERILSVRELGMKLEVNPNTVVRAYEHLQQQEIIANKRGVGYFVAPDAYSKIVHLQKEKFLSEELPALFKTIQLLGIEWSEIEKMRHDYCQL